MGESLNPVWQAVSAIEAIFEFRQIALRKFRINRVIAAQDCREIAQHRLPNKTPIIAMRHNRHR